MIVVVLAGLAGWRMASLLVNESGPADIFGRMRALAGVPDGPGEIHPRPFVGELLTCVWCASVYTAGLSWVVAKYVAVWPVAIMAAAALAILAEGVARHGTR